MAKKSEGPKTAVKGEKPKAPNHDKSGGSATEAELRAVATGVEEETVMGAMLKEAFKKKPEAAIKLGKPELVAKEKPTAAERKTKVGAVSKAALSKAAASRARAAETQAAAAGEAADVVETIPNEPEAAAPLESEPEVASNESSLDTSFREFDESLPTPESSEVSDTAEPNFTVVAESAEPAEKVSPSSVRSEFAAALREFHAGERSPNSRLEFQQKMRALIEKHGPDSPDVQAFEKYVTEDPFSPRPDDAESQNTTPASRWQKVESGKVLDDQLAAQNTQAGAYEGEPRYPMPALSRGYKLESMDRAIEQTKTRNAYFTALEKEQDKRGFFSAVGERMGFTRATGLSKETRALKDQWVAARAERARYMLDSIEERRAGRGAKSEARAARSLDAVRARYQRMVVVREAVMGAEEEEQKVRAQALGARSKSARHVLEWAFAKYESAPQAVKAIPTAFAAGSSWLVGGAIPAAVMSTLGLGAAGANMAASALDKRGNTRAAQALRKGAQSITFGGLGGQGARAALGALTKGSDERNTSTLSGKEATGIMYTTRTGEVREGMNVRDYGNLGDASTFSKLADEHARAAASLERTRRVRATGTAAASVAASTLGGAAVGAGFNALDKGEAPAVAAPESQADVQGTPSTTPTNPLESIGQFFRNLRGGDIHTSQDAIENSTAQQPRVEAPAATPPSEAPAAPSTQEAPAAAPRAEAPSAPQDAPASSPEGAPRAPAESAPPEGEVRVSIDERGEGANSLYLDLREQLRAQYAGETPPPVVARILAYENVNQLSAETGFLEYPNSAIMHRAGDGFQADTLVVSADGKTLTYIDAQGESHVLMSEGADGGVTVRENDFVPGEPTAPRTETPSAAADRTEAPADSPNAPPATSETAPSVEGDSTRSSIPDVPPSTPGETVPSGPQELGSVLTRDYPQPFTVSTPNGPLNINPAEPHIYQNSAGHFVAFGGTSYDQLRNFAIAFAANQEIAITVTFEGAPRDFGNGPDRWMNQVSTDGNGALQTLDTNVPQSARIAPGLAAAPDPYKFTARIH